MTARFAQDVTRWMRVIFAMALCLVFAGAGLAQMPEGMLGPPAPVGEGDLMSGLTSPAVTNAVAKMSGINPLEVLGEAGKNLPAAGAFGAGGDGTGTGPIEPGKGGKPGEGGLSPMMNVLVVMTVLTLAPSILLMCTCFVRTIMVLAIVRQAIGTQTLPPPQVTMALALFMTLVVMAPTVDRVYKDAIEPYRSGVVKDYGELWNRGKQPIRDFMFAQIEATGNWSSLYMMLNVRGIDTSRPELLTRADVDMVSLVPAFMLSELKTAFVMGFRIFLPFLVIDMVVSSILISMGMMMLPPVMVSLPFKLLLFVLVDGWQLIAAGLMQSFAPGLPEEVAMGIGDGGAWRGAVAGVWPAMQDVGAWLARGVSGGGAALAGGVV